MKWEDGKRSDNVEDARGTGGRRGPTMVGGGLGMIILVLVVLVMGGDPRALIQQLQQAQPQAQQAGGAGEMEVDPREQKLFDFSSVILADTEDVWGEFFRRAGAQYKEPKLVIYRANVESGCGMADSGMGPFYCPADEKVYLDLSFFNELEQKFQAPGDFAQAYVIAHEIGHHVQNLTGVSDEVHRARSRVSETEYNELSVRLELQADFYAGVWAHHAHKKRNLLEKGDIEEGLRAASAIGDDRLQKQARGYVNPDSFTHGTSEQRIRWFRKGLESGDLNKGDTFDPNLSYEEL
jgi:uncharacterized protein